jgi:DNA-binding IclR family transcriptional regulator
VLYLFKEGPQQEYGVSEISRILDLNKSTVHNILNTLVHHSFLVQNEATRRYRLGPALAELSGLVQSQINVREIVRPYLRQLMEQTNCTLLLSIFEGATITIVDKEEPLGSMRVAASIGMRIPFCAGASGQAFLAYLPDAKIEELLLKPGLKAFTPTSITNPDRYRATLLKVRKQGYAVDDNEQYLQGVGAIAVPLFAPTFEGEKARSVTAVITLVSFSSHLSPEKIAEFTGPMLEAGQKISGMLGR